MIEVLCVGGPKDGEGVWLPDGITMFNTQSAPQKISNNISFSDIATPQAVTYRLLRLCDADGQVLQVAMLINQHNPIAQLISGYRRSK